MVSWLIDSWNHVVLELQRHLAEREVRLDREDDALRIVRQPNQRLRFFGEDPAALGNLGADDEGAPLLARDADFLTLQDFDDDRIAVRAEIARVLVPLADFQRDGTNPVEERGVIERLEHRGKRGVTPDFPVEAGIGENLVAALAMLVALILDGGEAPRPK